MIKTKIKHILSKHEYDAVIFDLDGVITQSATIHAKAWKEMFDAYLAEYTKQSGKQELQFDIGSDYLNYIDGKSRYEGVKSFLHSRGIDLPYGTSEDSPEERSVCGLGNRKNAIFLKYLQEEGVEVYQSSVDLVHALLDAGFKIAIISSSKNCTEILKAAGVEDLFQVQIDGIVSEKQKLQGKPMPDVLLAAAKALQVKPERSVIIEDSIAGISAGKRGHFGFVIGIERTKNSGLQNRGADLILNDLSELQTRVV